MKRISNVFYTTTVYLISYIFTIRNMVYTILINKIDRMSVTTTMMMAVIMITFTKHPDTSNHITGTHPSMASTEQMWWTCE